MCAWGRTRDKPIFLDENREGRIQVLIISGKRQKKSSFK